MADKFTTLLAAAFTALCGIGLAAILVFSPQPMPAPTEHLFHALIGLFTAGGVTIFSSLHTSVAARHPNKRQ